MKPDFINLNSMTDIVSNSVGMLVLFSLVTLLQVGARVYDVKVPVEHETNLRPMFFLCKDDAVLYLDPQATFAKAAKIIGERNLKPGARFELNYFDLKSYLDPRFGIVFLPQSAADWPGMESLSDADSPINAMLDGMDKTQNFAYFFVYDNTETGQGGGSGFEAFRRMRAALKERGVKSGWMPVDEQHPAYVCFWSNVAACRYWPSDE